MMNAFRCALVLSDVAEIEGDKNATSIEGFNPALAELAGANGMGVSSVSQVMIVAASPDAGDNGSGSECTALNPTDYDALFSPTAGCAAPQEAARPEFSLFTQPINTNEQYEVDERLRSTLLPSLQRAVESFTCGAISVNLSYENVMINDTTAIVAIFVRAKCPSSSSCVEALQLMNAARCLVSRALRTSVDDDLPGEVSEATKNHFAVFRQLVKEIGVWIASPTLLPIEEMVTLPPVANGEECRPARSGPTATTCSLPPSFSLSPGTISISFAIEIPQPSSVYFNELLQLQYVISEYICGSRGIYFEANDEETRAGGSAVAGGYQVTFHVLCGLPDGELSCKRAAMMMQSMVCALRISADPRNNANVEGYDAMLAKSADRKSVV